MATSGSRDACWASPEASILLLTDRGAVWVVVDITKRLMVLDYKYTAFFIS
jgi:hypothetical protein